MECGFGRLPLWIEKDGLQTLLGFQDRQGLCEGVHDVPQISILVLSQEALSVAIVSLDLCLLDHKWQRDFRSTIKKEFGMESIIACTHTHHAPAAAHTTFTKVDEVFLQALPHRIIACLREAKNNQEEVEDVSVASIKHYGNIIMNRTYVDALGYMHKQIRSDTPARIFGIGDDTLPLDRDLNVMYFDPADVAIVNFGCHPNVMRWKNRLMSSDFAGALVDYLEDAMVGWKAMFLNGVAGDARPAIGGESFDAVEAFGAIMGGQAFNAMWHHSRSIPDLTLRFNECTFEIPFTDGTTVEAEMSCLAIGDIPILTIPGELYSSLGLQIKDGFEPRPIIVGYANGHLGYIPDRRCFEENHPYDTALGTWRRDGGLYLPGYGTPTVEPKPEIGDIVVKTARKLLTGMKGE